MTTAVDVLEELDFEISEAPVVACSDLRHPRGIMGHDPEAPGAVILVRPCCGRRFVVCQTRYAYMRLISVDVVCTDCHIENVIHDYTVIPLSKGRI